MSAVVCLNLSINLIVDIFSILSTGLPQVATINLCFSSISFQGMGEIREEEFCGEYDQEILEEFMIVLISISYAFHPPRL